MPVLFIRSNCSANGEEKFELLFIRSDCCANSEEKVDLKGEN